MTDQQRPQNQIAPYRNNQLPAVVRAEYFVAEALSNKGLDILAKSMPDHIDKDRFKRNLVTAVAHHDKLLDCDPRAVFHEAGKASALGFYLDPAMGEAYLITGFDSKKGGLVPQLRIGYRGFLKLGRQSGEITSMYAHEVRANDVRVMRLGANKVCEHDPDPFASDEERGPVVGFYAVVHFKNGDWDFEPMGIEAINRIRDRSDAWKAFKSGKIKSTPWDTDPEEMGKKTVLRRLSKRGPMSPEMAEAWNIEDGDYRHDTLTEAPPRIQRAQRFQIGQRAEGADGFHPDQIDDQLNGGASESAQEGGEPPGPTDATNDPASPPGGQAEVEGGAFSPTDDQVATFEEISETIDDALHGAQDQPFPGDKPPPTGTAALPLTERADAYETRLKSASNSTKLKSVYAAADSVRKALAGQMPDRLGELEDLFKDRLVMLEELEAGGPIHKASEEEQPNG